MNNRNEPHSPRLLEQLRAALRVKHYSYRTEKSYIYWVRRFIYFHNKKHPQSLGTAAIMVTLLYGSGLRLMECHRLRVKDIDFEQRQITVRDGKGEKTG